MYIMARSVICIVCCVASILALPIPYGETPKSYPFTFVSREEWGARPANSTRELKAPVPLVVIHHTYIPPECEIQDVCKRYMRSMQNAHQLTNGWDDIGYNFAVGGDAAVYEGRGWENVGAHAAGYNTNSIGIALIGDFVSNLPPRSQMETAKNLIAVGVELGYISPDYQLIGHRQAVATECPGQALFDEISSWDNFVIVPNLRIK